MSHAPDDVRRLQKRIQMSHAPDDVRRLQKRIAKAYRTGRLAYAYYLEACLKSGETPRVPNWGDLRKGSAYP